MIIWFAKRKSKFYFSHFPDKETEGLFKGTAPTAHYEAAEPRLEPKSSHSYSRLLCTSLLKDGLLSWSWHFTGLCTKSSPRDDTQLVSSKWEQWLDSRTLELDILSSGYHHFHFGRQREHSLHRSMLRKGVWIHICTNSICGRHCPLSPLIHIEAILILVAHCQWQAGALKSEHYCWHMVHGGTTGSELPAG